MINVFNKSGLTQPVGAKIRCRCAKSILAGFQQVRFNPTGREQIQQAIQTAQYRFQQVRFNPTGRVERPASDPWRANGVFNKSGLTQPVGIHGATSRVRILPVFNKSGLTQPVGYIQ